MHELKDFLVEAFCIISMLLAMLKVVLAELDGFAPDHGQLRAIAEQINALAVAENAVTVNDEGLEGRTVLNERVNDWAPRRLVN